MQLIVTWLKSPFRLARSLALEWAVGRNGLNNDRIRAKSTGVAFTLWRLDFENLIQLCAPR
jgi:hypothetical protein